MKHPEIVHTFTIDEAKWQHENKQCNYSYEASLLMDDGKMCCLGFFGKSCGVSSKNLLGNSNPYNVPKAKRTKRFTKFCFDEDGEEKGIIDQLVHANDNPGMDLSKRKRKIAGLFRKMGVEVKFINSAKK